MGKNATNRNRKSETSENQVKELEEIGKRGW